MNTKVEEYAEKEGFKTFVSEAYMHNYGTALVENTGRRVQQFVYMWFQWYVRNAMVAYLGFNSVMLKMLWGEWSMHGLEVLSMQPHPSIEGVTVRQAHSGEKPHIGKYLCLPPGIVMVLRRSRNDMNLTGKAGAFWQYALVVEGSKKTPGAGKFAVISGGKVQIITTTQFTGLSEGGSACTLPMVQKVLQTKGFLPLSIEENERRAREGVPPDDTEGQEAVIHGDGNVLNACTDMICSICSKSHTVPEEYFMEEWVDKEFTCADIGGRCTTDVAEFEEDELDPEMVIDGSVDSANILVGIKARIRRRRPGKESIIEEAIISQVDKDLKVFDAIWFDGEETNGIIFKDCMEIITAEPLEKKDWPVKPVAEPSRIQVQEPERRARIDPKTPEPRRTERVRRPKTKESLTASIQAMMAEDEKSRRAHGRDLLGNEFTYYADWANVQDDSYFYSHEHTSVIRFTTATGDKIVQAHLAVLRSEGTNEAEIYKAITKGVPRSWREALLSPVWGEAARKEWDVLIQTGSIVEISREMADLLMNDGAQELFLFPIYEEKIREGLTVFKVRLVADGAKQTAASGVFSATPSKEEFNVLMQIIASYDMDFAFLDELRAFLNAEKEEKEEIILKFRGDNEKYRVLKALYGLRNSPKNYFNKVKARLLSFGFKPLTTGSRCIYYKIEGTHMVNGEEVPNMVLVFHHVDDFLVAAFTIEGLEDLLRQLATEFPTTAPERNEGKYLGVGITRARAQRAIMLDMHLKIMDACNTFGITGESKERATPMPQNGFIIREEDFNDPKLVKAASARKLSPNECTRYMALVGVLIWISTVRFDIKFAIMYLSWFTKEPRLHHYQMGCKVLGYLFHTSKLPLVLGGMPPLIIEAESDCSLATGPKRRSILGYWAKMSKLGGAVLAKCKKKIKKIKKIIKKIKKIVIRHR